MKDNKVKGKVKKGETIMMKIIGPEEVPFNIRSSIHPEILEKVRKIIADIILRGDGAVKEYTLLFDRIDLKSLRVDPKEIKKAENKISSKLKKAIRMALENLYLFSEKQMEVLDELKELKVEVKPGVNATQRIIPLNRVGIYVPGGRYPLVSSLLMAAVPARVAGVKEIAVCSPPGADGNLNPVILYAASLLNIEEIFSVGGAQAIAALAVGTNSIKPVDKIVGPGNIYVTAAKKELYGQVGIDFIAGPTELLILADQTANPELVACDLIAQAEHDPLARPWLITDNQNLAEKVRAKITKQRQKMRIAEVAVRSLEKNGLIVILDSLEEAVEVANRIAPEHLSLMVKNPSSIVSRLRNYGSLFIGELTAETLGDYSSGLNHILPTNGAARYTGGLNVKDFLKFQTGLEVSKVGLKEIGPAAICLAEAEGLVGHAASIRRRLKISKAQ